MILQNGIGAKFQTYIFLKKAYFCCKMLRLFNFLWNSDQLQNKMAPNHFYKTGDHCHGLPFRKWSIGAISKAQQQIFMDQNGNGAKSYMNNFQRIAIEFLKFLVLEGFFSKNWVFLLKLAPNQIYKMPIRSQSSLYVKIPFWRHFQTSEIDLFTPKQKRRQILQAIF